MSQHLSNLFFVSFLVLGMPVGIVAAQPPAATSSSKTSPVKTVPAKSAPKNEVSLEGKGRPQSNTSGGKRPLSVCGSQEPIVPLVPLGSPARTTAARPVLIVNHPRALTRSVVVKLESEAGELLYYGQHPIEAGMKSNGRATLAVRVAPQLVRIAIPETAPALESGKRYQWSLAFTCGDRLDPNDPVLTGWIERVPVPAAVSQEQAKTEGGSMALVSAYESSGLWLDALSSLLAFDLLYTGQIGGPPPQLQFQILSKWRSLLQAEGLSDLTANATAR